MERIDLERGADDGLVASGGPFVWHAAKDTASAPLLPAGFSQGYSVAVKDIIAVRGHPVTGGSAAYSDAEGALLDAPAVRSLKRAGAHIAGGVAMHELAFGVTGINDYQGTPRNPWDPDRVPGGSSSGSAVAVAGGWTDIALGTDTGGSVRIPAALCGVVGYKPGYGQLPMAGVMALSPSLDHLGIFGDGLHSVAWAARAMGVDISGPHYTRTTALRVGVAAGEWQDADDIVGQAWDSAVSKLRDAGIEIDDVQLPSLALIHRVSSNIMLPEFATTHAALSERRSELLGPDVRARLEAAGEIPAAEYLKAKAQADLLRRDVESLLDSWDVIVSPTVPIVAPLTSEAKEPKVSGQLVSRTRLANVTGHPALSLPVESRGLPVGLQLMAASDWRLFSAASQIAKILTESG